MGALFHAASILEVAEALLDTAAQELAHGLWSYLDLPRKDPALVETRRAGYTPLHRELVTAAQERCHHAPQRPGDQSAVEGGRKVCDAPFGRKTE